ncbi:MAG: T9SS type A sorting domain-containing protein [Bacteroidia bacterium]|nr:T9SS type A sorting domain-containing protein [Bacteroidia bacterium]
MIHLPSFSSIRQILLGTALLFSPALWAQSPIGWASVNGGTTGGAGGSTVSAANRAELLGHASSASTLIIEIADSIVLAPQEMLLVAANKTIIGTSPDAAILGGGLWVNGNNVIIRNLSIGDSYVAGATDNTDAIRITAQQVWVDHCQLQNSSSGLIDIHSSADNVADYVTISYCHFLNQNSVMVIGESDTEIACRDHLRVTIHHCWFDGRGSVGLSEHSPRVRFGQVHFFNNYLELIKNASVGAYFESEVVVENNFFRSADDPYVVRDKGKGQKDPALAASGNLLEFTTGIKEIYGTPFSPSAAYAYSPDPAIEVPALVMNAAGLEDGATNQAPVTVTDTLRFVGQPPIHLIDASLNDTDPEGNPVLIAAILNDPGGNALVQNNRIYYYPLLHVGPDTIQYQVVDTKGGVAIGYVLVNPVRIAATLEEELARQTVVYPNPAQSTLQIQLQMGLSFAKLQSVELIDLSGRKLGNLDIQPISTGKYQGTWPGSRLIPGMYVLQISTAQGSWLTKIIVQE